jgi:hypothetical protein
MSVLSRHAGSAAPSYGRALACLLLGVATAASAGCGALNFLHRPSDGVINVQGAIAGLPSTATCDLKLLQANGRPVDSLRIAPVFDRSVVVAPAGARRRFEISCEGHPGTFRSRPYKSHDWTRIDLGTIVLSAQSESALARR